MKSAYIVAVFLAGICAGAVMSDAERPAAPPAERVTGIGGVFFKANDPKALSVWYRETLGVAILPEGHFAAFEWREHANPDCTGVTIWSLFRGDSSYFAPSEAPFMINYRVNDLDRMLAHLRARGVTIEGDVLVEANGRFAWIMDPEGNKIELWEPKRGRC